MARLTAEEKARLARRHKSIRESAPTNEARAQYLRSLEEMSDAELEKEIRKNEKAANADVT